MEQRERVILQVILTLAASAVLLFSSLVSVTENFGSSSNFNETRALNITRELSTRFPRRHVSHMDIEGAALWLKDVLLEVKEEFGDSEDQQVEVFLEQVSGANGRQVAFGFEFANAYNNLTNVVMTIRPKRNGGLEERGGRLLVNAHYDSTLGSPGASDCGSCVGVAVEVARGLLGKFNGTDAVFLFNGGEETLMQAAHGFIQASPSAKDVASFINIESTGPWGPDVLFQYQGWALDAYARSAPRPRGNSVAQDFFELGLIPADTDYRVLRESSDKVPIPGIDVAFLFDGVAYHTKEDTWDRIRPGTLQGMGENVLATAVEFMRFGRERRNEFGIQKSVFADIGARWLLVYPFAVARVLHLAPLAFFITRRNEIKNGISNTLSSLILALLLPSILGASRAFVSGQPLSFYGSVTEACLMYIPAALAGLLLPIASDSKEQTEVSVQSFGALFSIVAFLFTAAGMTSSYVSAWWAAATALSNVGNPIQLIFVMFTIPCYFGSGIGVITMLHVVEKIGLAGGTDSVLGRLAADSIVGTLAGLSTLLCIGSLAPWLSFALGSYKKRVCRFLVGSSLFTAVLSSSYRLTTLEPKNGVPYSKWAPKRMIIQHIMRVDDDGKVAKRSISVCSMDSIPVTSPGILPSSLRALEPEPFDAGDWVSFYPLNFLITGKTFRDDSVPVAIDKGDDPADASTVGEMTVAIPSLTRAPLLYSVKDSMTRYVQDAYGTAKAVLGLASETDPKRVPTKRHYFELDTVKAGWAVLNITADIVGWSLSSRGDDIASVRGAPRQHIVRYASGPHTRKWQFWIDVPRDDSAVEVDLFVKHFHDLEPRVAEMVSDFDDYVSAFALTVWRRQYSFI